MKQEKPENLQMCIFFVEDEIKFVERTLMPLCFGLCSEIMEGGSSSSIRYRTLNVVSI